MTKIVGIDPGVSGALAYVDTGSGYVDLIDMPIAHVGKTKLVDGLAVATWLTSRRPDVVVLEHVGPQPTDGKVGAFTFGGMFGSAYGIATALGFNVKLVRPQLWKTKLGLNKDKARSMKRALQLYPDASPLLYGPRGGAKVDRAEALLMAHWETLQNAPTSTMVH